MALFPSRREFEGPGPTDRVAIVGTTGEGKTVFAMWLFSEYADFDKKPWVLVDYKGEILFDEMMRAKDAELIALDKPPPERPGIYVVKPRPREPDRMADFIWNVYERGNCGLVFDELSMVPEFKGAAGGGGPLKSVYTQGRSKRIPVWGLVQRPVDVNLHAFSEADFIAEFYLKKRADRDRIDEYIPDDDPIFTPRRKPLERRWCRWWDDKRRISLVLKAAPPPKESLDTIAHRVAVMRERRKI